MPLRLTVATLEFDPPYVAFAVMELLLTRSAGETDILCRQVPAAMPFALGELLAKAVDAAGTLFVHDLSP